VLSERPKNYKQEQLLRHCNILQHTATRISLFFLPALHTEHHMETCVLSEQPQNYTREQFLALKTLQHTALLCTQHNTPQHTATHCNTPQHTVTHRNTPQHAATFCTTHNPISHSRRASHGNMHAVGAAKKLQTRTAFSTQHIATHCNALHTLQHSATHCNTLQHNATHCNTPQHTATRCDTLHHSYFDFSLPQSITWKHACCWNSRKTTNTNSF